tara:strand:- start:1283 stop:1546 length:264 start_codon:yes stop_codon:yes gene_type:complete
MLVATSGVSNFIDLNLGIRNILLFFPTRCDQYKAGPLVSIFINIIKSIEGKKIIVEIKSTINISISLFIIFIYKYCFNLFFILLIKK